MAIWFVRGDNMGHRVVIFNPYASSFSNPTILAFLAHLKKDNAEVLIVTQNTAPSEIPSGFGKIKLISFTSFAGVMPGNPWRAIAFIISYVKLVYAVFLFGPGVLIGIDQLGLIAAGRLNKFIRKRLVYLSFELMFNDEIGDSSYYLEIKKKEKYYSGQIDCLVIQDKLRHELLKRENDLKNNIKTFLIPVSPVYEDVKADNIYNMFGIPLNKTLIIHSGSIADWSGMDIILSLIKESRGHDVHFVIHSHKELSTNDPYKAAFDDLIRDGYPVSIHNHPFVDYAMYCGFLKGFHIGLAFYVSAAQRNPHLGKNLTNIGLASGKFSTYMMVGLPAIVNLEESFSDLFKQYKFGGILKGNNDFFSIANRIKENFYTYSTESKRFYNEILSPEESVQFFFKDLFKS